VLWRLGEIAHQARPAFDVLCEYHRRAGLLDREPA
jgi:hypothetical protein